MISRLSGNAKILLAISDIAISDNTEKWLNYFGYDVTLVNSIDQLFQEYHNSIKNNQVFHIVVIDVDIQNNLDINRIIDILKKENNNIKFILIGRKENACLNDVNINHDKKIIKPYSINELESLINLSLV